MQKPLQNPVAASAVSALRNVRSRTWLILGGVTFGLFGLLIWAGISVLSWLWGQAPAAANVGNRVVGDAIGQLEQAAPGLKEQIGLWVPGLKDLVGQWAPNFNGEPLASDVSGVDLGPVPRFTGLLRTSFTRGENTLEVRYAGPAAFEAVRTHYIQGFTTAGYAQEVIGATADGENHRFTAGQETIELELTRQAAGRVQVQLKSQTK
jgi:hypothetical protein